MMILILGNREEGTVMMRCDAMRCYASMRGKALHAWVKVVGGVIVGESASFKCHAGLMHRREGLS